MVVVIFEVVFKNGCTEEYLEVAASLKESLANAEGFLHSERFSSLVQERKVLSMSIWEDEASVEAWRNLMAHRLSQQQGRNSLFEDFRITVADIVRQYTMDERAQAPMDSNEYFPCTG